MMREILFRGKRVDNGEWVDGFYNEFANRMTGEQEHFIQTLKQDGRIDLIHKVIPETVGQYTGLTDKNGKRIFEGDVGRYKQTDRATQNGNPIICIGNVVYNAKTASFAVESKDEAGRKYFDYFPIKDFEVIGNIPDNPDLMEVE